MLLEVLFDEALDLDSLAAVAAEIGVAPDQLVITYDGPICGISHSNAGGKSHRLNGGAK